MNTAESILALVLTLAAGAVGGTFWGQHLERKNQDAETMAQLKATLTANSDLAKRSKPFAAQDLQQLKAYAAENGIDIGDATRKADIRAAIDASRA